jgi:hypothetical protein
MHPTLQQAASRGTRRFHDSIEPAELSSVHIITISFHNNQFNAGLISYISVSGFRNKIELALIFL